jgi:hypothetical protein
MTSAINYTGIDPTFPVAGQDNDSQGFRDNFGGIQTALQTAKTEITGLQTNAVLKANLANNTAVVNDMLGSTISNGLFKQFSGVVRNAGTILAGVDIDLNNGPLQIFSLTGNFTLTFRNWPLDNKWGMIRIHLKSDGGAARTATLSTENAGVIVYEASCPALTLNVNQKHKVIEAWSYNHGATVYVRYLGEY